MMLRARTLAAALAAAVVVLSAPGAAFAADAAAGRQKANACAVCHGALGLSTTPDAPNLAGQPALYVSEQLRAYRSGKRVDKVMTLMAKPLSDDDIDNIAAWYASLKIQVQPVP